MRGGDSRNKKPPRMSVGVFWERVLAVTYVHMGRPHTIIGETPFHV